MKPLIWIIDEEWADYELEMQLLRDAYPGCDIRLSSYDYQKDLADFGRGCDAIICQVYANMPAATITQLERCKIIAVYGGGYDRVDTAAARQRGIAVTNVSGYCAEDLADYVMAAIYHGNKQLLPLAAGVKGGRWGAQAVEAPPKRICDSVLHIIGLGRIGKTVAAKALGFNMTITAYDPYVSAEDMAGCGVKKVSWEEGLAGADYISVNAILTEETTSLVRYADFELMKKTVYLINTARGKIINEDDMLKAVERGCIRGAVLDVIANEPPSANEKIFGCQNILVTPHISYISQQSYAELKRRAAGNVITALSGGVPRDLVN